MFKTSLSPELAQTMRRRTATLAGAILVGLVALAFAKVADLAQSAFVAYSGSYGLSTLVLTPVCFAGLVYLTRRFVPEAKGSGIPQVIAATRGPDPERSPLVSLRTAIAKLALTLAGLLVGASSGREGPTVQVAASIMTAAHRLLRVPLSAAVVIAGGAAGVSAAFNTPLAGVTFAIEEIAASYEQRLTVLVMAAVVISGLVSLGIAGDYVYFGSLEDVLTLVPGLIAVPIVAVVGGALGGLFSRLVLAFTFSTHPSLRMIKSHPVLFAAVCGLVIAVVGIASGGISWGTGYEPARTLIEGDTQPLWFALAKFIATLATTVSGIPGGVFAPSLSVGAGLGGLMAPLFPGAPPGTIAIMGMMAYFVGVVRAPLTSTVIVMEMTGGHSMLLGLFACALIAERTASLISPQRLYHGLARQFHTAQAKSG